MNVVKEDKVWQTFFPVVLEPCGALPQAEARIRELQALLRKTGGYSGGEAGQAPSAA